MLDVTFQFDLFLVHVMPVSSRWNVILNTDIDKDDWECL